MRPLVIVPTYNERTNLPPLLTFGFVSRVHMTIFGTFFAPVFRPDAEIVVWGPPSDEATLCDRIALMHHARLRATGTPDELKRGLRGDDRRIAVIPALPQLPADERLPRGVRRAVVFVKCSAPRGSHAENIEEIPGDVLEIELFGRTVTGDGDRRIDVRRDRCE